MGSMITPGFYENVKYASSGMDCAGVPVRPGFLQSVPHVGLPYRASGGKRRLNKSRRARGGALGVASSLEQYEIMRSTPGVAIPAGAHTASQVAQKGGRYEISPGVLLGSGSDIGMRAPAMAHSIPCEQGAPNALNQRGGSAFPAVHVGAADMMRYQAPHAGYENRPFALPAGGASPGFLTQIPYAAGSMNRACLTTGGKRSKRSKRSKRNHRK